MTVCMCGAEAGAGAYLCRACTRRLVRLLRAIPGLVGDLAVTIERRDRVGEPSGRSSDTSPLLVNVDAMARAQELGRALIRAAGWVSRHQPAPAPPFVHPARLAVWLVLRAEWMSTRPEIHGVYADVHKAAKKAVQAIDVPTGQKGLAYLGPCGWDDGTTLCTRRLWAANDRASITCGACGTTWDVTGRRLGALTAARDQLATAPAISRALTTHQFDITTSTIRVWKHRGQLTPAATNDNGASLYRVGDVLDLVQHGPRKDTP